MSIFSNMGCLIPEPTKYRVEQVEHDPSHLTDIERRLKQIDALLSAAQVGNPSAAANHAALQRAAILQNMRRAGELARVQELRPHQARGFQAFLARDMAVSRTAFGMGDAFTQAGFVRESMQRAKRLWRGGVSSALREMAVAENMAEAQQEIRRLLRPYRLRQNDLDYIMVQAQELGWVPELVARAQIGVNGRAVMMGKVDNFVRELTTTYGLTEDAAQQVLEYGSGVAKVYREVNELTARAGLDIGSSSEVMGYFPRTMSAEARQQFNWKWENESEGTLTWNTGRSGSIGDAVTASRQTNEFIVEDEVLLDYVVRHISRNDFDGDSLALYREATGIPDAGVADLLDDHRALRYTFVHMMNRHPDILDHMVDNGLLSKIPMTSVEVFDLLRNQYKMPFENLRQVFLTDWRRGWEMYRRQLDHIAEQSGYVHMLVRNAVEGNWGVSIRQVQADPATYDGFRPLVSNNPEFPGVLQPDMLPSGSDTLMLQNIYVHPTVAQMTQALIELQRSPNSLGIFARTMQNINRTFRSLALATWEYIPRQIWNTFAATGAGGGDLLVFSDVLTKLMISTLSGGRVNFQNLLQDTGELFRTLDGRNLNIHELWDYLQDTGFINHIEPNTADLLHNPNFSVWNPKMVMNTLTDGGLNYFMRNSGRAAGMVASQVGYQLNHKLMYPIRLANTVTDTAGRFAAVLASMRRYNANTPMAALRTVRRAVTTGGIEHFDTVEEAVDHWRNYFFMYDDATRTDRILSNYVVPFWGFHSKNLPAAVRHAVRHPSRYVAYQRLYAMGNSFVVGDDRLNEATTPGWQLHGSTIYFRMGDEDDQDAEFFAIPMASLDPFNSAYNFLQRPADAALSAMGIWNQTRTATTGERLDSMPWAETETNRLVDAYMETTFPMWQALANTVSGRDDNDRPLTEGTSVDSFMGYRMSPMTRMWIETLLPALGTINRYNPGGVFGTPTRRDPWTGNVVQGEGSRMPGSGGVQRSNADTFWHDNPYTPLMAAGIKIYPVDWALNAGYTYDDLRINLREGERFLRSAETDMLRMEPGSEIRAERERELADIRVLIEATRVDMNRLEDWARLRGLNVLDAAGQLRADSMRIGDLPDASGQLNPERDSNQVGNGVDNGRDPVQPQP